MQAGQGVNALGVLTVPKIRAGNSNIRNPILVSYVAKGLLPYRGLGSGIKGALEGWPQIDFTDDREGNLFVAIVHRKEMTEWLNSENSSEKSSEKSREGERFSKVDTEKQMW